MKAGGLRLHAPILSAFVSCVRLCPSVGRPGQGRNSSHRSPRSPARRDGDTHGQGRVHCAPKEYAPWVHPPRGDIRVERGLARPKSQVLAQHGSRASSNPSKASKVSVTSPVRQLDFERGCPWCSRSLSLPLSLSLSLSLSTLLPLSCLPTPFLISSTTTQQKEWNVCSNPLLSQSRWHSRCCNLHAFLRNLVTICLHTQKETV